MKKPLCCLMVLIPLLSACWQKTTTDLSSVDTSDLQQLESVQSRPLTASQKAITLGALRATVLRDTAMSLGAQAGLAVTARKMNAQMEVDRKYLETIYNFNGMMLNHGVLPPVLEEGRFTLNLDDPNTIRVADRFYKIIKPARFATTPPNWREYLIMSYDNPELPDKSLLPRSDEESRVWREGIRIGYERGIAQSYTLFQQNLNRLKRDFRGMALYRKLLAQHMISAPFVSRTELGITGDGDDMRINDQILRIVEPAKLQSGGQNWKAAVIKHAE